MQVHLWERYGYAGVVESELDVLGQGALGGEVVSCFDPRAHQNVDAGGSEFADSDQWLRLLEQALLHREYTLKDLLGLAQVVVITNSDDEIDTSRAARVVVDDLSAEDVTVRKDDFAVVRGPHGSAEDVDVFDDAFCSAGLNEISGLERAKYNEHKTGRKVLERILEGETNGETSGTENGDERSGGNAEPVQGGDDEDEVKSPLQQAGHKIDQHIVDLGTSHPPADQLDEPLGEDYPGNENQQSEADISSPRDEVVIGESLEIE